MLAEEELQSILSERGAPRVSLYLPTHEVARETREDRIRFGNMLRAAGRELEEQGHRRPDVERLLAPAMERRDDALFWQDQGRGLAVFLAGGGMRAHRLREAPAESWHAGDRWHVKPLLPLLAKNGRYFVLALSRDRVRLLEATVDTVREVDLGDAPRSLEEATGRDGREKSLQFHTGTAGSERRAMFHGQGAGKDGGKEEIGRFLRLVDKGVLGAADRRAPLVVAAVESLAAGYRAVSDHPMVREVLPGNADELTDEELRAQTWPLVEPLFTRARDDAAAAFERLRKTEPSRVGDRLESVLPACVDGRVESLFVAGDEAAWGRFEGRTVERHEQREPGGEDLLDRAAAEALLRSGSVHVVDRAAIPGQRPVAAVLRY